MKNLSLLMMVFFCFSCGDRDLPNCINDLNREFRNDNRTCDNASIISYDFQSERVYAYADGTCISDGGVRIVNADCEDVCFLGGIGGFTDCNGDEFFDTAVEVEVIWEQ